MRRRGLDATGSLRGQLQAPVKTTMNIEAPEKREIYRPPEPLPFDEIQYTKYFIGEIPSSLN